MLALYNLGLSKTVRLNDMSGPLPIKAPNFQLPAAQILSLNMFADKRAVILVFFDARRSDFCMKRLKAFQALLKKFAAKKVQIFGISVDDNLAETALWAAEIGVKFPLLADHDGTVCSKFGLLNAEKKASERALVVIRSGKIVFREVVKGTAVPTEVLRMFKLAK